MFRGVLAATSISSIVCHFNKKDKPRRSDVGIWGTAAQERSSRRHCLCDHGMVAVAGLDVVAPMLEVPEWVPKSILLLLGAGFPIALLFAWAFELTPRLRSGVP